jgi:GH15 family glucan-1,4-alpha-glucosidase
MKREPQAQRIEDYAIIGDCRTAALVSRDGSIDWMCAPRFDSAAFFAALLGGPGHGHFRIAPTATPKTSRRRYRGDTLVLETEFEVDGGTVAVIDFMPIGECHADVVRIVEGRRGEVEMSMELDLRFDYGAIVPWIREVEGGIVAIAGPDSVRVRFPMKPENVSRKRCGHRFVVHEGERVVFDLAWFPSHEEAPKVIDPFRALAETERYWLEWAGKAKVEGPDREAIVRSLVTLKALTYAPTGGIVAAATTSLPEHFGGVRNWDYRYCWLRDATFTLIALMDAGYIDEARAFREWLLRAAAGEGSALHIMYGVAGERRLVEQELPWLRGFAGSKPVRVGNAAYDQRQLDVFGELFDTMHQAWLRGLGPGEDGWRLECELLDWLEGNWHEPDEGIWEVRGPRRHFTHSKVMAWVAVDRAVKGVEGFGMPGPVDRWKALRAEIHAQVCKEGYDPDRGSFVQFYGGKQLDGSLLTLPLVGFLPIDDPRIRSTATAIERELLRDGFVYRYDPDEEIDGLPDGESSFLLCSFWLADVMLLQGRRDDARALLDRLLSIRNDVGLLSEGYDPVHRRLTGNFPQAFSHIGLVNTARSLADPRASTDEIRRR